ncbi:MAG TPA: relaxase/mobilization nuclease domain-containing protein [Allosphingosinicella sp.]|nr:relaxase/mobilization nuclease domain-containing protein [Allosphingosinicella sp.]
MILKGSQRAGASGLAAHLLNEKDNEHVRVHELRGFAADDLHGALTEAQAVAKGTKCKQFLFSLSLNPPQSARVGEAEFERAADQAEKVLGLDGQPRAIVFHEKEGRLHAHVVWSRIDASKMRAVNMAHFKRKLTGLSKELFLEHGWTLPEGLRSLGGKSPLNFDLSEWQQAKRQGSDPREVKDAFREAWARSDNYPALAANLAERGFFLAQGGRRAVVAVDLEGKIYALAKWTGIKVREARAKPGEAALPSLDQVQNAIAGLVTDKLKALIADAKGKQLSDLAPIRAEIDALQRTHAREREELTRRQQERWARETQERSDRLRAGLLGLWDNITGRALGIRRINEREALIGMRRDRSESDALILGQLDARQPLQAKLAARRRGHVHERRLLTRELVQALRRNARRPDPPAVKRTRRRQRGLSLDR